MKRTATITITLLAFLLALQLALVTDALARSPERPSEPSRPAVPTAPATPALPAAPAVPTAPTAPATPATPADPTTGICESLAGHAFQPAYCTPTDDSDDTEDDDTDDSTDDDTDNGDGDDGSTGDNGDDGSNDNDGQDGQDGSEGGDGGDGSDGQDGQDGDDTNTGDETDEDIDGNASTSLGHVIITEVLYDLAQDGSQGSESGGDNEWVELYNATDNPVDLLGWSIGDGVSNDVISNTSFVVPSGGYVIITDATTTANFWDFSSTSVVYLGSSISGGLSNAGDSVLLYNASSTIIDAVSYGDSTTAFAPSVADVPAGNSITRTSIIIDTDTAIDWTGNGAPNPGSQI